MVQFDTIIFCRTFKNYFGQFVWIEKKSHYNSRVSLHEAPTKNYIEFLLTPERTWETIELDHVRPLSSFDLINLEQIKKYLTFPKD